MPINPKRKVQAYRNYFQEKYQKEVMNILENSKSLEEADEKLEATINKFDTAWEQVKNYYPDAFKDEE